MSLTAEGVIAELDRILVEQFELDPAAITPEARLREDLDLDSLDAADMLVLIEKKFGIRMDDTVVRTFRTVGDVYAYVRTLVDARASAPAPSPPADTAAS